MKFCVAGRDVKEIEARLLGEGFEKDEKNPDFVFCIGGDGTILLAERKYPSIPKIAVRRSDICKMCVFGEEDIEKIIRLIKEKKYKIREYTKLEAELAGKVLALNEIQVHNESPAKAIRFSVYADKKPVEEGVIGDGIVIATPYGSGAYYYSVGGEVFEKGIGLGFNNPHRRIKPRVLPEGTAIEVKILRGNANVFVDNFEKFAPLKEGSILTVVKSKSAAKLVVE